MDLKTTYLGLELDSPLMPGACPLTEKIDKVRELEDAGAPAIVMPSAESFLFRTVRAHGAYGRSQKTATESTCRSTSNLPASPYRQRGLL